MNSANHFETIVCEHYEPLFRFAMSLTRVECDAWDLTQQTFYIWATKGHQLRDLSRIKTWLFTTLHRAFLKARRRQVRFPHDDLEQVSAQLPVAPPQFAAQSDCAQVLAALGRVDEVYQGAVALFYLEDYSYKEIAAILEVPVGTVKSRIARGITQLRQFLLPDDSCVPSRSSAPVSLTSVAEEPSASRENELPAHQRRHTRLAAAPCERSYREWDLSSTLFPEPFGGF